MGTERQLYYFLSHLFNLQLYPPRILQDHYLQETSVPMFTVVFVAARGGFKKGDFYVMQ